MVYLTGFDADCVKYQVQEHVFGVYAAVSKLFGKDIYKMNHEYFQSSYSLWMIMKLTFPAGNFITVIRSTQNWCFLDLAIASYTVVLQVIHLTRGLITLLLWRFVHIYVFFFSRIAPKPFFRQLAHNTLPQVFILNRKAASFELHCSLIPSSIKKTEPFLFQMAENSTPAYIFKH